MGNISGRAKQIQNMNTTGKRSKEFPGKYFFPLKIYFSGESLRKRFGYFLRKAPSPRKTSNNCSYNHFSDTLAWCRRLGRTLRNSRRSTTTLGALSSRRLPPPLLLVTTSPPMVPSPPADPPAVRGTDSLVTLPLTDRSACKAAD